MPKKIRLPSGLPTGSKYVIEDRGRMNGSLLIHRHVELPDGHRVELPARACSNQREAIEQLDAPPLCTSRRSSEKSALAQSPSRCGSALARQAIIKKNDNPYRSG